MNIECPSEGCWEARMLGCWEDWMIGSKDAGRMENTDERWIMSEKCRDWMLER